MSEDCISDEEILGLLEGRLHADERTRIEAHVDSCDECLALIADAGRMRAPAANIGDGLAHEATLPSGAPSAFLARGSTVDRYMILDPLGRGGMGVVYRAYDPELDRQVALKLVRPEAHRTASLQKRLVREAKVMARVSHPNVLTVYDAGIYGDHVFIAMELIDGGTLAEWGRVEKRSWRDLLERFVLAGRGLAAAHSVGLVHRDFKPDNVLVGKDGRVRVADFGLALPTSESDSGEPLSPTTEVARYTRTGAHAGTPGYMAPEQIRRGELDPRTDLFSFCVALYEALLGVRPFVGDTPEALLAAIESGRRSEPTRAAPRWLRSTIERGLAANPQERYPTMDALLTALDRDPRRRWRRLAPVALTIAIAVSALVGFHYSSLRQLRRCSAGDAPITDAWNATRKQALHDAFVATKVPYAAEAANTVAGLIDDYAHGWTRQRREACEATRIRGQQSEEMLDLRVACLTQNAVELHALVDVFSAADKRAVSRAVEAVGALPSLDSCADTRLLKTQQRLPSDPATRLQIETLDAEEARARALVRAGKYKDALTVVTPLPERARDLHYHRIEAESLRTLGTAQELTGDQTSAISTYRNAALAAEAGARDDLAADAFLQLAFQVGHLQRHPDEGLLWAAHAASHLERMGGGDPKLRITRERVLAAIYARVPDLKEDLAHARKALLLSEQLYGKDNVRTNQELTGLANALEDNGLSEEALSAYTRDNAILERAYGPSHPGLALNYSNMSGTLSALGRNAEAVTLLRKALVIQERALGPDHYLVGQTLDNLACALAILGQYDEAITLDRRALRIWEKSYGDKHALVAMALTNLGEELILAQHATEAVPLLERALGLRESLHTPLNETEWTRFRLAQALWGSQRGRARLLANEARHALAEAKDPRLPEIDGWLATAR